MSTKCIPRLDRLGAFSRFNAKTVEGWPAFEGFKLLHNRLTRKRGPEIIRYLRFSRYVCLATGDNLVVYSQPSAQWLYQTKLIFEANVQLSKGPLESVLKHFPDYSLSLAELALDFHPSLNIDNRYISRYGVFGKSLPAPHLEGSDRGTAYYGDRRSSKLVRCYHKPELNCHRVELELHAKWLRQQHIVKLPDLAQLSALLVPRHIQFLSLDVDKLSQYLVQRDAPPQLIGSIHGHRKIHSLKRLLSQHGVPNNHRFFVPRKINNHVREALTRFSRRWER